VEQLKRSLSDTLSSYRQWAGQLRRVPDDARFNKSEMCGRLSLEYGTPADPGVELVIAHCPHALSSLCTAQGWIGHVEASTIGPGDFSSSSLVPLAGQSIEQACDGQSCVLVQLTTFTCGGLAISLRIAHCLADARSMQYFMQDWAEVNRAMVAGTLIPALSPVSTLSCWTELLSNLFVYYRKSTYSVSASQAKQITDRVTHKAFEIIINKTVSFFFQTE
jgi:Transferase family